jgi:hypothetical protein
MHGRFTSPDPLLESAMPGHPQSWNRYIYVGNDPLNITDPTGLSWYYNSAADRYKWFKDGDTVDDGFVSVVGTRGNDDQGRGSFVYEREGGGWVSLNPYANKFETFDTRDAATGDFSRIDNCESCQALVDSVAENAETKGRTVRMAGTVAGVAGTCIGTAGAGCAGAVRLGTAIIEAEMEAANAADTVSTDVHGNSLSSPRPTWDYELYDNDGNFLKNGITSQEKPENRYTKGYMEDKKMRNTKLHPNRRAARDVERRKNTVNPGPLNRRR